MRLKTIERSIAQQGRKDEMSEVGERLSALEYSTTIGLLTIRSALESLQQLFYGFEAGAQDQPQTNHTREESQPSTHGYFHDNFINNNEEERQILSTYVRKRATQTGTSGAHQQHR